MDRRSALALLAAVGLSGCSFEPVAWVTETPEPEEQEDPAVELRADFFVQTSDTGVKSISEAEAVGLRVSTPHFDARLEQVFLGDEVGRQTAMQARRRTPLRAPEGHRLLGFTLQAGQPRFQPDEDTPLQHVLRVGASVLELKPPFGRHSIGGDGAYDIPWTLIMLCVPEGQPVTYEVTDEERTVVVDLVEAAPVEDEAWAATQALRERQDITLTGDQRPFLQQVVSQPDPALQIEAEETQFTVHLRAASVGSLLTPWLPRLGWAAEGRQWLRLALLIEPTMADAKFRYDLDAAKSFTYEDSAGVAHEARDPRRLTVEDVTNLSDSRLDVTFEVSGTDATAIMRFLPQGTLEAGYREIGTVPAAFVGQAVPVEFTVGFIPQAAG